MRWNASFFLAYYSHLASASAAVLVGHRARVSGTRSTLTSRRGRGARLSSVSRGGRSASGGRASTTRRSSRLHGGDDVVASGPREEDTSESFSAGDALIALSCRSRVKGDSATASENGQGLNRGKRFRQGTP